MNKKYRMTSKTDNRSQSYYKNCHGDRNQHKQILMGWVLKSCGSVGNETPASAHGGAIRFCYGLYQLPSQEFKKFNESNTGRTLGYV